MLALIVVVLVFMILKSIRLPDWFTLVVAVGAAIAARHHFPGLDIGLSLETIGLVMAGLVTLPFWLGPVMIFATQRQSAAPVFAAYDPQQHTVPESIAVALRESEAGLSAEGFASVGEFFQSGFMQNMTMRVTLLERPATRQQAIVAGMYMNSEPTKLLAHYVEIVASFTDGTTLLANNSPMLGSYARVEGKTVEHFPNVRDPRRLVRIHDGLIKERSPLQSLKPIDREGDGGVYLSRAMVRELEQQVPTGYLRLDTAANAYRPTLKGALLMTWKQIPPISTLRMRRVRRRADEILTRLGITGPEAAPATVPALEKKVAWPAVVVLTLVIVYAASADTVAREIMPASSSATPLVVPTDFAVPPDFPGAVKALETLTGARAEQLVVIDSLGFPVQSEGAAFGVEANRADSLIAAAQPLFLAQGFYLFRHEPNYGIGGKPDEVGLAPLRDQFAVVKLVGTTGANHDLTGRHIIAWLRDLERDAPFVLTGIGFDHVEGRFLRPIGADADSLAARLYRFCPDVVDQGAGSVRELANEIARTNTFFCWWD